MSKLFADMGNSRIKYMLADGPQESSELFVAHDLAGVTKDWSQLGRPDSIWVCSVARTALNQQIIQLCQKLWHCEPNFIQSTAQAYGLTNAYEQPQRLGSDRWLAMLAARYLSSGAVLVADAGTALTIDAVDAQGTHLGGWIVPGIQLMQQALLEGTQIHADLTVDVPTGDWGRSTRQGIQSGALMSLTACIDRAYDRFRQQHPDLTAYLTGGDACHLQDTLQSTFIYEPALVCRGLAVVAEQQSDG